jgi:hypothetical protein
MRMRPFLIKNRYIFAETEKTTVAWPIFGMYDWPARLNFRYILSILPNCKSPIYISKIVADFVRPHGSFHAPDWLNFDSRLAPPVI